jgi:hypothetical protein
MTIDVRRAPSNGGVLIRDTSTRAEVFVEYERAVPVAMQILDEVDKERQRINRRGVAR